MEIASMQSSWAVGFLVGGVLLSIWGGFRRKIFTANLAMFGTAVGLFMVGIAHNIAFQVALAGIFLAGAMNVLMNGPAFALLQTVVEDEMQGRVFALVISLTSAMAPIGLLIAGPVAERVGVSPLFIFSSLMFVASGLFTLFNAHVRSIEDGRGGNESEHETAPLTASTPAA